MKQVIQNLRTGGLSVRCRRRCSIRRESSFVPRRRRCIKRIAARISFRPIVVFLYMYLLRGGFLDGKPGLIFCLLRLSYELQLLAKLEERRHDA